MDLKPLTIILAEDDDGHATLICRNLKRTGVDAEVVWLHNGFEVLEYVRREIARGSACRPLLLLLDIRMPGLDGIEVLQHIKSDPALRTIPVYMLTTTDNPAEVDRCFELGCNAYLTKPVAYDAFTATLERLCAFLEISHLPGAPPEHKDASA